MGSENYFCCGKSGHKVRNCPNMRGQEKGSVQDQSSCPRSESPRRTHFYTVKTRVEQ